MTSSTLASAPARLRTADCDLDDFVALVQQTTDRADYPLASEVVDNVLVYDARRVADRSRGRRRAASSSAR